MKTVSSFILYLSKKKSGHVFLKRTEEPKDDVRSKNCGERATMERKYIWLVHPSYYDASVFF